MNNTLSESLDFVYDLIQNLDGIKNIDIGICPTYLALYRLKAGLELTNIKVGAQNVYFEDSGAFTGEISAEMLKDINMDYCIIGHSERRKYFNETDEDVNKKLKKLLEYNITPIICVGESLEQRENAEHFEVVKKQIVQALKDVPVDNISSCIIAYEPIWAIGTGKTATSSQAEEMCKYIRDIIKGLYNDDVSETIRIQYGGSVNISNAKEILTMPNIDGALIGGASLKLEFVDIIKSII